MLPIKVTVGPLATASANAVSLSQKAPGAFALAIDGALSSNYSATNIAQAQAVAGAGSLTLNGTLVSGGVAYLDPASPVVIVSSGNDSGITFTVTGMAGAGNSFASVVETVTGANASRVSTVNTFRRVTSITASGAAAGTVSAGMNGTATLDMARRILFTSAGDDSGITFTVTGTDWNGAPISQTVTGANASAVATTLDFKTISRIVASGATASTVTVGTNGVASSRPIHLDYFGFSPTSLQIDVSGTVNATVQQSLDDPNVLGLANVTWLNHPDSTLVGATAAAQGNYAYAPNIVRLLLNSGSGTVSLTAIQSANVPA